MKRTIVLLMLMVATTAAGYGSQARADGLGFFPSELKVADGLRGQRYVTGSVIINQTPERRPFRLSGTGDVGPWISFAVQSAPDEIKTEVVAEPNSRLPIIVYVSIPATASNGTYTGEVFMENYAVEGQKSDFVQAFRQAVSVTVTGTQKLSLRLNSAVANNVEMGQILRIQADVGNQSNIDVAPTASAVVQPITPEGTLSPAVVGKIRTEGDKIPAGGQGKLLASWDTVGQPLGKYRATLTISSQGQDFGVTAVDFQIVPVRSLVRAGSITSMVLVGVPPVGTIARVDITFANKGEGEVMAGFVGQVYLNGAIVSETASTIGATAAPNTSAVVSTFFRVDKEGKYTLRGKIHYDGAQTDEAVLEFQVGDPTSELSPLILPLGLAVVAFVVVGGGTGVWWRRRRPSGKSPG